MELRFLGWRGHVDSFFWDLQVNIWTQFYKKNSGEPKVALWGTQGCLMALALLDPK